MAISKFSKRVNTTICCKTLKLFRYLATDMEMKESQLARFIIKEYLKTNPPKGFNQNEVNGWKPDKP